MIHQGDALTVLRTLPAESVQCCVTSPPYWGLRDYGVGEDGIGLERTPEEYVAKLVAVFREVRRVLRKDGTLWLNLGDSYAANRGNGASGMGEKQASNVGSLLGKLTVPDGLKPKDLVGIPWRVAFALQADGWYLRSDIIWAKPNPMPESVTDRPTKAHEYLFLLSRSERYYYDGEAIAESSVSDHPSGNGYKRDARLTYRDNAGPRGGDDQWQVRGTRNRRTVWTIPTQPYPEAHFAVYPEALVEPCILAGTGVHEAGNARAQITVLDPFLGSGTTLAVAKRLGREGIGIELNPEYCRLAQRRIDHETYQPSLLPVRVR